MKRTVTIDNKKLFRSMVILILTVLSVIMVCNCYIGSAMTRGQNFETVIIKPGDTLWSIAEEYNEGDIRKKIKEIKKFNNMDTSALTAYEVIRIPID